MNSGGVFCFFCVLAELSWFMQYTVKRISFGDIHSLPNVTKTGTKTFRFVLEIMRLLITCCLATFQAQSQNQRSKESDSVTCWDTVAQQLTNMITDETAFST